MSRRSSEPHRPLRRLPGWGGTAVSLLVAAPLLAWSQADVDAALAMIGVASDMSPTGFALVAAPIAGIVGWAILYLMFGPGGWLMRKAPALRRPLGYDDLGPPPPREQPLPVDLDQPLSAFDPEAIGYQRR